VGLWREAGHDERMRVRSVVFAAVFSALPLAAQVVPIDPRPPVVVVPPGPPAVANCPTARRPHVKPRVSRAWSGLYRDRIVVKLVDDSPLVLNASQRFTGKVDRAQLVALNAAIANARPLGIVPLFRATPAALRRLRADAEARACRKLADLTRYFRVYLPADVDALQLVNRLNESPLVEIAFLPPIPGDADKPPFTGNFQPRQDYLERADRGGIDAIYAWSVPGGRGQGIRVIDVEVNWNVNHEDLPPMFWFSGVPLVNEITNAINREADVNAHHGTAVAGELVARNDGSGVTGIVSDAEWGAASIIRPAAFRGVLGLLAGIHDAVVSDAIEEAVEQLRVGDVILIEQHSPGPPSGTICPVDDCSQFEFVPLEYFPDTFDVIETATASGIVVVEAAGNGNVDLDREEYERRFDITHRDSGAILVGASSGETDRREPNSTSNSGSRVDVHGWGDNVMTTGWGAIRANGNDPDQFYTDDFEGTSSASPIVAGAAVAIQGVLKASGHGVLTPVQLRDLLTRTGSPQTGGFGRHIGPLPNLRAALGEFDSATAPAGGSGGEPFRLRCPSGMALVGIRGQAGAVIDQLRGICASPAGEEEPTRTAGGVGGTAFRRRCEEGKFVIGMRGRAGAFLDSLELECAEPSANRARSADIDRLDAAGGAGGAVFGPNRCPVDRVSVGMRGRAAAFIDRVQLLCSSGALTAEADLELPWRSRAVGGTGGTAAKLVCSDDEVMVGVSANAGAWLDSIAPRCVAVNASGAWSGDVRTGTRAGGGGGTRTTLDCPRDHAVSGVSGKAAAFIDRLRIRCRAIAGLDLMTGDDDALGSVGGNGGEEFGTINCPANLPALGFGVRTGAFVDRLGLICGHERP